MPLSSPRVLVVLDDGVVQIFSDDPNLDLRIVNYDAAWDDEVSLDDLNVRLAVVSGGFGGWIAYAQTIWLQAGEADEDGDTLAIDTSELSAEQIAESLTAMDGGDPPPWFMEEVEDYNPCSTI